MSQPEPTLLKYAEAATNEVPDYSYAAEQLIDAREPPSSLLPFFRTSIDAAEYFKRSMQRRYPHIAVANNCSVCGQLTEWAAVVWWKAVFRAKWREIKSSGASTPSETRFCTGHALCPACEQTWRRQISRHGTAVGLSTLMLVVFGLSAVMLPGIAQDAKLPIRALWIGIIVLIGSLLGAASLVVLLWLVRRGPRVPESIRALMPRKLRLQALAPLRPISELMTVRVRLFAFLALKAGGTDVALGVPFAATLMMAMQALARRCPAIAPDLDRCAIAVNCMWSGPATVLKENDEVSIIPTGGEKP